MIRQFPCYFEINEFYLRTIYEEFISCRFGTFFCNTAKHREDLNLHENTPSIWRYFREHRAQYINPLYEMYSDPIIPSFHVRDLYFWREYYLFYVLPKSNVKTAEEKIWELLQARLIQK